MAMRKCTVAVCFLAFVNLLEAFTPIGLNLLRGLTKSHSTLSENDIFYPTPAVSLDGLSEDEVLYDLFLRQFVGDDIETKPFYESDTVLNFRGLSSSRNTFIQRVVEVPVPLLPDTPLEIVYKSRVAFANFVSIKIGKNGLPSSSLLVRLVSGEIATIDVGQIVSCWDQLADEGIPTTPTDWAQVRY